MDLREHPLYRVATPSERGRLELGCDEHPATVWVEADRVHFDRVRDRAPTYRWTARGWRGGAAHPSKADVIVVGLAAGFLLLGLARALGY